MVRNLYLPLIVCASVFAFAPLASAQSSAAGDGSGNNLSNPSAAGSQNTSGNDLHNQARAKSENTSGNQLATPAPSKTQAATQSKSSETVHSDMEGQRMSDEKKGMGLNDKN